MATTFNPEDYITDVTNRAITISGVHYSSDVIQIVKDNGLGEFKLEHSFYSIDDLGVTKKLGGFSFKETGGSLGMSFDVTDDSGVSQPVLELTSGGVEVSGGNASFGTSSVEVEDIDLTLGSGATTPSDIDKGGIILGTPSSGEVQIIYSQPDEFWSTNTGFNIESGNALTVNTDTVILDESGLKIDDIVLSQTGLAIGQEVSITSSAITLGSTDPVILNSNGLTVGTDLSLDLANGLKIDDITLSQTGLAIGADVSVTSSAITLGTVDPVILNSDGLSVGSTLSLDTTNGLLAGDITLNSTDGLVIGTGSTALILDNTGLNVGSDLKLDSTGLFVGDTEFSVANGLVFDDVTLKNTGLTFEDTVTGDVVVDNQGVYIGPDISLTKNGGLSLGSGTSLSSQSIAFGSSPNETFIDDTGVYIKNNTSAIYMGDSNQWKISFDSTTNNLQFQFFNTSTSTYVVKAEMKST